MHVTRSRLAPLLLLVASLAAAPVHADGADSCLPEMKSHIPAGLAPDSPLVVVLHGCTQSAAQAEIDSGWSVLADRYGFAVVYPEQRQCANPYRCFNWFEPGHTLRGQGEVHAIKQMVDAAKAQHSLDPSRVYVAGFSAGAAMAVALLAAYPEVFAAGAVAAALPYRIANGSHEAFPAMMTGKDLTPKAWGDLVRETHPGYQGGYPRLAVFHGSQDRTVNPINMRELLEQWTDLHATDQTPDDTDSIAGHPRRQYRDGAGRAVVATFELKGMPHALPVDPGQGPGQGGQVGQWAKDVDLYAPWYAARFWGLIE